MFCFFFLNVLRGIEETFTKYFLRLPQQPAYIRIWRVLPCPDLLPLGQWKAEALQAASFSCLTDVHLLPDSGVSWRSKVSRGSEVHVSFPCQEQDLCILYGVTVGQTPTQLAERVGQTNPTSSLSLNFDTMSSFWWKEPGEKQRSKQQTKNTSEEQK